MSTCLFLSNVCAYVSERFNFEFTSKPSTQYEYNQQQTYHTVGTSPKFNIKFVERGKIDTTNTQIHDCSLIPLTHKYMTAH